MLLLVLFAIAVPGSAVLGAPTLTTVHIESSNFHSAWARVGDTVTLTFSASEDVQNVSVTIATHAVTPTGGPVSWTATYDMQQTDLEGAVPFTIDFENLAAEPGSTVVSTTDGSSVTFDKTPPGAPSAPDLTALSDSGMSDSDDITNATLPVFEGTASADSTEVLLYKDGAWERTELVAGGAWLVGMNAALTDGSYDMTATVIDAAGNMSDPSPPLTITVDTIRPEGSGIDLAAASDTGKSDSDGITRGVDPQFVGEANDKIEGGVASGIWKVEVWSDDGKTGSDEDGTYYDVTLATLDPGGRTVSGRVYDVAGNTYDLGDRPLLVDRTAPTGSVPDLTTASDTGDSNTDDITQGSAPQFTGTASDPWFAGVSSGVWKVVVSSDDGKSATDDDGTYYDVTLAALNEGNRSIEAIVYDVAGNPYDAGELPVTVDRTPPSAPSTPDLMAASDTGTLDSDEITKVTLPMFQGTANADATQALLFIDGGWERTESMSGGTWQVGVAAALSEGTYSFTAQVLDAAGNLSVSSGGLPVTIDTTPPWVSAPDLADASDTGQSSTDGITKALAPQFTGSASDSGSGLWKVEVAGDDTTSATDDDGTYYGVTLALSEGSRTVQATAYDVAGNTTTSSALPLLIDRTEPSGSAPNLAAASDTGSSDSDNVTQGNTPQFTGNAADAASGVWKVVVSSDDGKTADDDDGTYYGVTLATLNEGNRSVGAVVHDRAGNTFPAGALSVTVDRTAPSVSGVAPDVLADADAGSVTVDITFDEPMSAVDSVTATVQGINDSPIAVTYSSWPSSTIWRGTFPFTDDNETVTSAYYAISGAQDLAGNTMTALTSRGASNPLNVDSENPTVTISVSDTLVSDADAGGIWSMTARFTESMSTGAYSLSPDPNGMNLDGTFHDFTYGFTATTVPNDTFTWQGDISDIGKTYIDVDIRAGAFTDAAGNALNPEPTWSYDAFTIDMTNPSVSSVSVDTDPVYEGDLTQFVTVTFNEPMDPSSSPTIRFKNDANTAYVGTWTSSGGGDYDLLTKTVWTETFTLTDNDEEVADVLVTVGDAQDAAGNYMDGYGEPDAFDIDVSRPSVSSVTVDTDPVYESGLTQFITVTFDEAMLDDGTADPSIAFSAGTWASAGDGTYNPADSVWTETFTHDGAQQEDSNVTVDIVGTKDASGNDQEGYAALAKFDIDTKKPTPAIATSPDPIYEDAKTLTVTVTYDEAMNPATSPVITLTGTNWGAQTPEPVPWTSGNTVYTCTFTHNGTEEEIAAEVASIAPGSAATDVAGNVENAASSPAFEVDTRKPEVDTTVGVSGITIDTDPVYEGDLTQRVTVTFDEAVDSNTDPTVSFSHGTWTTPGGSWTSATVWGETFTLIDNDEEYYTNPGSTVEVDVNGARDAAGNLQEPYAEVAQFDIDTLQPTLVDATSSSADGCYTTGAAIDITLTFSEDVQFELPIGDLDLLLDVGGARAASRHVSIPIFAFLGLTDTASDTYVVASDENSCDLTLLDYWTSFPDNLVDWAGNVIDYQLPPPGSNIADHKDIVVDTTIPVAVKDPNGNEDRTGSDDSAIVAVRWDPYGQYRLAVRKNTPVYIDVKFNDSDLPCGEVLMIYDIPNPPDNGSAWFDDPAGNIRYAPDEDYVGPDEFTYRIYDACGNVSLEETVYVEVVLQLVIEDQYLATCVGEPLEFDVTVADLFIPEEEFTFTIFDGPYHGVVLGDLDDLEEGLQGLTTNELETLTVSLEYVPAEGFLGQDSMQVRVADAFGGSAVALVDILVNECGVPIGPTGPDVQLIVGEVLPIVVPLGFEVIHETAWTTVTLTSVETGISYAGALSAVWSEEIGRFVLSVDSTGLPPGEYLLVIPLGNDETVTLVIEVGES